MARVNLSHALLDTLVFAMQIFAVLAQQQVDGASSDHASNFLKYRPPFSHSLHVQILASAIICTLLFVLLLHLLLTARYHYLLAPTNFAIQLSAVICLLVFHIASLAIVLRSAFVQSQQWPYMLAYVAVMVPPLSDSEDAWRTSLLAAWCAMKILTSALIQMTHIQFLTLLFPMKLDVRLTYLLLGPLALLSAVTELRPVLPPAYSSSLFAIRTTCNATLSLLYSAALLTWGTFVAPRRAWRSDGGTSAFGVGALLLAALSTALSFVCIPGSGNYSNERCTWIPGLVLAVILWQSYLGWWWWVGAVSGGMEEADKSKTRTKRMKDKARRLGKGSGSAGAAWRFVPSRSPRQQQEGRGLQEEGHEHGTTTDWSDSPSLRRRRGSRHVAST
ncbi:hypothetical protein EW146_g6480 [Bondarzewia mesenterica]|uniref:Uncharacterized protein n=1 Tax=Bondarzewia mesenterica TaxID=1095465 RepID=A0A4S4LPD7_9AGAM|nr:hypothetical protein EW146_g6480 [Bondarzewia mesenterica]